IGRDAAVVREGRRTDVETVAVAAHRAGRTHRQRPVIDDRRGAALVEQIVVGSIASEAPLAVILMTPGDVPLAALTVRPSAMSALALVPVRLSGPLSVTPSRVPLLPFAVYRLLEPPVIVPPKIVP